MQENNFLNNYAKKNTDEPKKTAAQTVTPTATPKSAPTPAPAASATEMAPKAEPKAAPVADTASKKAEPITEPAEEKHFYQTDSGFRAPKAPTPTAAPQKPRRGGIFAAIGGVAIVAVIVLVILLTSGGNLTVPDFSTYTVKEVNLWCTQNSVNLQKDEAYSDSVALDGIIDQSRPAGEKIKKNDFLSVTVSLGSDPNVELTLPDLKNMSKSEIESWAAENHMTKVRITTEASDTVETGKLIRYEINDNTVLGDVVKRSTPIYIIFSKGSAAAAITVPNFSTMTLSAIDAFARENGVTVKIVEEYDQYASAGSVLSQSVKSGEKISRGDTITVTLSKGQRVTVPDFSKLTEEAAQQKATALGIRVNIEKVYSTLPADSFISQSVAAGKTYDSATIELRYSLGNSLLLNSFVGQQFYLLSDFVNESNAKGAALVLNVTYTQSSSANGTVISQNISNSRVATDTVITVVVSNGKRVFMPDFIVPEGSGYDVILSRDEIIEMCGKLNITPVFQEERNAKRRPGEVWKQSVAAGTEVAEGSVVVLSYAPATGTCTVPDFNFMIEFEVKKYSQNLDIVIIMADAPVDGYAGRAYKQSVAAGTTVAYGTEVIVYVSPIPVTQ